MTLFDLLLCCFAALISRMCGIGGILRILPPGAAPPPEAAIPEAWLDLIDEAIKHRGPDGKGRFRDRVVREDGSTVDVALVHRRLSIIDHRDGWQPMVQGGTALLSREGGPYRQTPTHVCPRCRERTRSVSAGPHSTSVSPDSPRASSPRSSSNILSSPALTLEAHDPLLSVVFNGCIYNHRELRKELEAAGHVFATDHSDTEVLLHGWKEWGKGIREHADGMYAMALWDRAEERMALFRDRFGEKPLYILGTKTVAVWTFASTATGVQNLSRAGAADLPDVVPGELDLDAAKRWIAFGHDDQETPFRATLQVPAGLGFSAPTERYETVEKAAAATLTARRARSLRRTLPRFESKSSLVDRFDLAIDDAVASRLESDVPLGCFLSGGVDSSLVARAALRHVPHLRTISVRMPDPRYDESIHAQAVASIIGSDHVEVRCDPRPAADLVHLVQTLGLPFGDSSLLPTFWASCAAAEHVKVVLSGDGGDELFLGYERYGPAEWIALLHLPSRVLPFGVFLSTADPKSRAAKLARLWDAAAGHGYEDLIAIFPFSMQTQLFHGKALAPAGPPMSRLQAQAYDLRYQLPGDMLRKVDTASMMVALEVRAPLLARTVADAALELPPHLLRLGGQRKGLLRAVARKYFPSSIVDRPKQGFAIPIGEWFRSDYGSMKQLLLDHLNSAEPWGSPSLGIDLNMKFVRRMLDEHMGQRRDHSQRLYMLLVLSIWAKGLGR